MCQPGFPYGGAVGRIEARRTIQAVPLHVFPELTIENSHMCLFGSQAEFSGNLLQKAQHFDFLADLRGAYSVTA